VLDALLDDEDDAAACNRESTLLLLDDEALGGGPPGGGPPGGGPPGGGPDCPLESEAEDEPPTLNCESSAASAAEMETPEESVWDVVAVVEALEAPLVPELLEDELSDERSDFSNCQSACCWELPETFSDIWDTSPSLT
jgi:hypothetical protein